MKACEFNARARALMFGMFEFLFLGPFADAIRERASNETATPEIVAVPPTGEESPPSIEMEPLPSPIAARVRPLTPAMQELVRGLEREMDVDELFRRAREGHATAPWRRRDMPDL